LHPNLLPAPEPPGNPACKRKVLAVGGRDPVRRRGALRRHASCRCPSVDDPFLRTEAVRATAAWDDAQLADLLLTRYPKLSAGDQGEALGKHQKLLSEPALAGKPATSPVARRSPSSAPPLFRPASQPLDRAHHPLYPGPKRNFAAVFLDGSSLDLFGKRIFTFTGNLDLSGASNTITGSRGMRIQATGDLTFNTTFNMAGAAGLDPNPSDSIPAQFGGGRGGAGMETNAAPATVNGSAPGGAPPVSGIEPLAGGTSGGNKPGSGNPGIQEDTGGGGHGGVGGIGGESRHEDDGAGAEGAQGVGGFAFGDPVISAVPSITLSPRSEI